MNIKFIYKEIDGVQVPFIEEFSGSSLEYFKMVQETKEILKEINKCKKESERERK